VIAEFGLLVVAFVAGIAVGFGLVALFVLATTRAAR